MNNISVTVWRDGTEKKRGLSFRLLPYNYNKYKKRW